MTREEIIKEIEETEKKLSELKDKLINTPTTSLKEQFQNVLIKGDSYIYIIDKTPDGFIHDWVAWRGRYTTVYVEEMVEEISQIMVDNYKDYLEIQDILGIDEENILNEYDYNKHLNNKTNEERSKQYFLDFINDIIKAGVSQFEINW